MRKVNYWAIFIAIFFIYGYLMASYTDLKDWQIILSAAIFGGIGMELFALEVLKIETQQNNLYLIVHTLEELFEMIGISIFNYSLMKYVLKYRIILLRNE